MRTSAPAAASLISSPVLSAPFWGNWTRNEVWAFDPGKVTFSTDRTNPGSGDIGSALFVTKYDDYSADENYHVLRDTGVLIQGLPTISGPSYLSVTVKMFCTHSAHKLLHATDPNPFKDSDCLLTTRDQLLIGRRLYSSPGAVTAEIASHDIAFENYREDGYSIAPTRPPLWVEIPYTLIFREQIIPNDKTDLIFVGIRQSVDCWTKNMKVQGVADCNWHITGVTITVF